MWRAQHLADWLYRAASGRSTKRKRKNYVESVEEKILYHGYRHSEGIDSPNLLGRTLDYKAGERSLVSFFTPSLRVAIYHAMYLVDDKRKMDRCMFNHFVPNVTTCKSLGFPAVKKYTVRAIIRTFATLEDLNNELRENGIEELWSAGMLTDIARLTQYCKRHNVAVYLPFDEDGIAMNPSLIQNNLQYNGTYVWYTVREWDLLRRSFTIRPPLGGISWESTFEEQDAHELTLNKVHVKTADGEEYQCDAFHVYKLDLSEDMLPIEHPSLHHAVYLLQDDREPFRSNFDVFPPARFEGTAIEAWRRPGDFPWKCTRWAPYIMKDQESKQYYDIRDDQPLFDLHEDMIAYQRTHPDESRMAEVALLYLKGEIYKGVYPD